MGGVAEELWLLCRVLKSHGKKQWLLYPVYKGDFRLNRDSGCSEQVQSEGSFIWEIRAISEGTEGENQLELAAIVVFLLLSWNPKSWVMNNVKKIKSFLIDLEAEQSSVEGPNPAEGLLLHQIMGDSMIPAEGILTT